MRQNILPLFKKNQIISPFEIIIQKKKRCNSSKRTHP